MVKAFLTDKDMARIFKSDMLDNESLRDIFNGLVYPDYDKPFECVGTKKEINLSLNMIIEKYNKQGKQLPALLREFKANIANLEQAIEQAKTDWNEDNNLPEQFEVALREYIK